MMVTNRKCRDCGCDISNRGNRAIRCKVCQEKYRCRYKKKWDKIRHRNRYKKCLGNPEQDNSILDFIRKKRRGLKTKKYKALPDDAFYTSNEAGGYIVG